VTVRQPGSERRRQIAEAALSIIAERGLGKFTTAAVAASVGLSDGALFRHFKSKGDIVFAVIPAVEARLFDGPLSTEGDPLARLESFVCGRIRVLAKNPAIMRLIFSDQLIQASGDEGIALVRRMQRRSFAYIRDRLFEAHDASLLKEGLSPDHLSIIVYGTIFGVSNRPIYEGAISPEVVQTLPGEIWSSLSLMFKR
jgi:AcrR family transcriptional regulator